MKISRLGGGLPVRRLIPFLAAPLLTAALLYLPDPQLREIRRSRQGVVIADRRGQTLYSVPTDDGAYQHRLSWTRIPAPVREIFVRLEDRRFYSHGGVDLPAAARALFLNLRQRRIVSGASTITMQLARMIHPHGGGLQGKALEVLRALHLEAQLSKRQILLLYLNNLPFGYNTLGVGAAAQTYFSLPLERLTRAQILLLAVIPKAPGLYDPFESEASRASLRNRAASLASLLSVSAEEIDRAMLSFRRGEAEFRAPHFVRYVLERLEELPEAEDLEIVRVMSTLEVSLYREVSETIRERLAAVRQGGTAAGGSGRGTTRLRNASALVLNNRSGEILAWVGSQDFFDAENGGQIDGVRLKSSSGSTLKPFLYAAALERGYTASTLLPDLDLTFGAEEGYRPENFDRRSRGLVRLRTALASSLNVPAVYVLSQIGLEEFLTTLRDLGFAVPEDTAARVGLGAAVGNLEVSLLQLSRAFGVFPNRGLLNDIRVIREFETADGRTIPAGAEEGLIEARERRVFGQQTAWLIADILADPAARASGFGTRSRFNTSFQAVFKSGTASEYTSLWCIGALTEYTVGVWAGNFDGRPAFGATGSSLPAEVAVRVLEELNRRVEEDAGNKPPERPCGIGALRICALTGYRASSNCPATRVEYYLSGSAPPQGICPVHGQGRSMEELLLQLLLGQTRAPKILFPRDRMVFYREGGAAANSQGIPGWIVADPKDRISVQLNGRVLPSDDPSRLLLPVEPGSYRLEVRGRFGREAVSYAVR